MVYYTHQSEQDIFHRKRNLTSGFACFGDCYQEKSVVQKLVTYYIANSLSFV